MKIRDMQAAEVALQSFVPLVGQMSGKHTTLNRILPLMKIIGNPQDRLRVIHLAGTSGKTSTAYYLAALLGAAGSKTGLTISPHIDTVSERVQINGQSLSEVEFCSELGIFLDLVSKAERQPSYFELLYAFALWVFDRQKVDYAVVETGMGGLLDATNVVTRHDKICIITDIGLDHTHILGQNLTDIATQKVGIVHNNNTVFTYRQSPEIMRVIEEWTIIRKAPLFVVNEETEALTHRDDLTDIPDYQRRNWLLAYRVFRHISEGSHLQHLTRQVLQEVQKLQIPARMDVRKLKGKTLIMDGAHNAQKMTAFVSSFKKLYPDTKPTVLLALKEGKEHQELVPLLGLLAARVIITTFNTTQDLPVKSMDPRVLAKQFLESGIGNIKVAPDQHEAFQSLIKAPEEIVVITGSFYLLSQLRKKENI